MDVTGQTFPYYLPRILEDLATSVFVSIDLEFSGIATPSLGKAGPPQSLQRRYQETKESADKYQILQVGLTICHEDMEAAKYTLKPYNLYLSPIIARKLEVERNWSFQSSAIEFLLENKFNMDALYRTGVPYLSREEEAKAVSQAVERQNQTAVRSTLDVKETDYESLAFLNHVRQIVDNWIALGDKRDEYLNIPPPSRQIQSQGLKSMPSVLNRFQKRLVHQLVEVEYRTLVSFGRPTFVQIVEYDEEREKTIRDQRVQRVQERARKETGFRWVAEALAGGDLSNLNYHCFSGIRANAPGKEQGESLNQFADGFKERLKAHRPVLVGHNLFTDLVYFFRCFFGPLPDHVEDFQSMVHEHFPVLVDTKYLATHDCGSINPISSLKEINDSLLQIPTPTISIHPHFARYQVQKLDHEAGYDSLLTAQVFIKLSAQLGRGDQAEIGTKPLLNRPPLTEQSNISNRFSQFQVEETSDQLSSTASADNDGIGSQTQALDNRSVEETRKANRGHLIPRSRSRFWTIYGNKLRVFGTEERVCQIGS